MRLEKNKSRLPVSDASRGFTLIELMVAVAIVAILAGLAYPSYVESVRKAKRAEGRAALMQLMQQQERYYSQHNSYIRFSAASSDAAEKAFKWYSGNSPASSAYEISAEACAAEVLQSCVRLTAQPGTANVDANFKDPVCGNLTLSSTGAKSAASSDCWR